MQRVSVIGAGAWGTALASVACRAGRDVLLWSRNHEVENTINARHENAVYLPGISLPKELKATMAWHEVAQGDVILLVTPAQALRGVCGNLRATGLDKRIPLVICSKGVEQESLALMTQVVEEALPGHPVAILSGPNFASEVAESLPAATTLACKDAVLGKFLTESLATPLFRIYYTQDVIGAQVGGAVKNVLAIACGIAVAKELGENAKAALITRGLAEMRRLCLALGGKAETLLGLSGIGDVVLTCNSQKSRNMSLGLALGEGKSLEQILGARKGVTEGVTTATSVVALAKKHGVEMPIARAVYGILHLGVPVNEAIHGLLHRPFGEEF